MCNMWLPARTIDVHTWEARSARVRSKISEQNIWARSWGKGREHLKRALCVQQVTQNITKSQEKLHAATTSTQLCCAIILLYIGQVLMGRGCYFWRCWYCVRFDNVINNLHPWKCWGSSDSLASDGMVICPRHYMCHAESREWNKMK